MRCRILHDRMQLPWLGRILASRDPLDRAAGLCIRRLPVGPDGEIESPVAVDVIRREADVVFLRLLPTDHMLIQRGFSSHKIRSLSTIAMSSRRSSFISITRTA